MTPGFTPSIPLAAYASMAFTTREAIQLVTDHTSLDTACAALTECTLRSLPLSAGELAMASLMEDQDGKNTPSLETLHFELRSKLLHLRYARIAA